MKMLYAAYGSNMNVEQMSYRCPEAVDLGIGEIIDYEMYFSYKGVANIQPKSSNRVPVVIWELTENCVKALDRYEGYPHLYTKCMVPVLWQDTVQEMMVYILREPYRRVIQTPSKQYLNCILEGYTEHNLEAGEVLRLDS